MKLRRSPDSRTATWPDAGIRLELIGDADVTEKADAVVVTGPFTATVDLDPARSARLVTGYQSWDYAGIRPAAPPQRPCRPVGRVHV